MAPVASRGRPPAPPRPLAQSSSSRNLHPRDESLMIGAGLNNYVARLLRAMERDPESLLIALVRWSPDLKREVDYLVSLCNQWVDKESRRWSITLSHLMEKATEQCEDVRRHVFSLVQALEERNTGQVMESGQQLTMAVLSLAQICGKVTLAAWYTQSWHAVSCCDDQMTIYLEDNSNNLTDVSLDLIENFMAGCMAMVAMTFEDSVVFLVVCKHLTANILLQGSFVSKYSQVLRQLQQLFVKATDFLQSLRDEGVGRTEAAGDHQRRPLQYHGVMYWRFQVIMSRLKVMEDNARCVVAAAEALDRDPAGTTTARQQVTQFSKTIVSLAKQLLILHTVEMPSDVRERWGAAAEAEAGAPAGDGGPPLDKVTLLTEHQTQNLQFDLDDVDSAKQKLVGYLNTFMGVK